ncbi:MAG TPA: protein translocase subunit SecD [Pirellulales bacterium]|jgi:SecD/SecF fusion protein|nr:protein translocase subunit SecD [Pirellulales bacterium]
MVASKTVRALGWALTALVFLSLLTADSRMAWAQATTPAPPPGAVEGAELASPPAQQQQDVDNSGKLIQGFLIVAALFVGSVVLGTWIGKVTRLSEQGLKFTVIVFSILAPTVVCIVGWPPKLGIDLSGGLILIYSVDESQIEPGQPFGPNEMDKLVGAITRRVNPGGIKEVTVRPYGQREIEIIIPKATQEEEDQIKAIISTSGALEFRVTANERDHADVIAVAKETKGRNVIVDDKVVAKWVPVDKESTSEFGRDYVVRQGEGGRVEVLVMTNTPEVVTGQYLRTAQAAKDQRGQPCVTFSFDSKGAQLFGDLTTSNLPDTVQNFHRHLAVILDGELITAPSINGRIYDRGEITSNSFTDEQTTRLAAVLTAGALPAVLQKEPSTSLLTGPQLGADTIQKGVWSMLVATAVVVVFMIIYYRFAGMVANIAVILNVLLTIAFMILFHAAFTLSGLAGLALTVGMAVDANVLIYERMREELARGATLRMAIRNGFDRATTTIIDANVTTLISAVVLFYIGTDQVKGFAVTLILGIVMNLFTAITVSRAFFDVAERNRWITQLKMMQMMSKANYDFIGKRKPAIALSVIVIAIGMVAVVARGEGLLDIDFTGGVSVETVFDQDHPQEVSQVRAKVQDLPDVTVQDVKIEGEKSGVRFLIVTSEPDIEKVERDLKRIFKGELAVNKLTIASTDPIPGGKAQLGPPTTGNLAAAEPLVPDETMLALADDAAAKDPPSEKDQPAAKATPDATKKPDSAEKPAAAKPKAAEKTADKPAAEQPEAKQPNAEKPNAEKPAAEKPGAEMPAEEQKPALVDPFAGGTRASLQFSEQIGHDALVHMLRTELDREGQGTDLALDASNPEYASGSKTKKYNAWVIKFAMPVKQAQGVLNKLQHALADSPVFPSSNKIGATVADNTQKQALFALIASIILIALYVWFRFTQVMFGFAAILALVHDVLVTLGALALSSYVADYLGFLGVEPFKINLPIIAAFLTIIGYSLNDTIVIFDRIREIRGKSLELSAELVNSSINQTLSRTLLTSLTVFLVVLILYAIGGQGIHGFAFALVVGVISGTYSTVYIATPVLIWLNRTGDSAQAKSSGGKGKGIAAA